MNRSAKELAIGIIGCGSIGTRHLANLEFMDGNRVVAVCDADGAQASKMAARTGARPYADVAAMFRAERDLDAVLICVPPSARLEIFKRAAERGVAVFSDKPPAASMDAGRAIARIVRASGIISCVGFNYRYSPAAQRARELLLGRPVNLVLSSYFSSLALTGRLRPWFYRKEISGGHVLDDAIHLIDLMRFLAGDIVSVHTLGNNVVRPKSEDFTVEDTTCTTLRFASGAAGVHVHSWATPNLPSEFRLIGRDYVLALNAFGPPRIRGTLSPAGENPTEIAETFAEGRGMGRAGVPDPDRQPADPPDPVHFREMQIFLDAVRTGDPSPFLSPWPDALKSLAVALAMNRSIDSGKAESVEDPGI